MSKSIIPEDIREFEKTWKADRYDIGWFLTLKQWNRMTRKETEAYHRGLKAMLKTIKTACHTY